MGTRPYVADTLFTLSGGGAQIVSKSSGRWNRYPVFGKDVLGTAPVSCLDASAAAGVMTAAFPDRIRKRCCFLLY